MDTDDPSVNFKLPEPPDGKLPIFCSDEPWTLNACLGFHPDMSHGYIDGYRIAADRLVDFVRETEREQDYLVYPILFLYRHHFELRLKEILGLLHKLGERNHRAPKSGHDIKQFWQECVPHLKKFGGGNDQKWIESVTACICQIAAIDPGSDGFRYPVDSDGRKSIDGVTSINLLRVKEAYGPVLDWLGGVSDCLSVNLDYLKEYWDGSGY